MFNDGRRFSVTGNKLTVSRSQRQGTSKAVVGRGAKEEAFIYGGASLGVGFNSGNTNMQITAGGMIQQVGLLAGLVPQNEKLLRKFYRDIYYYDAVGGSAADMLSSFPYSEFTLTGVEQKRVDKYVESMVRLNIRQLMPQVTLGYLVDGEYCSSLIFNQKEKVFVDLINYPVDDCTVEHLAFQGLDPIITVKTNEALRRFIQSNNRQAVALRSVLPKSLMQVLQEPAFELDPLTALYVARRTIPGSEPLSWLKRILPAYLFERTLFRSTLVEAQRRVRSMLHIAMGDDTHEFTPEEMAETVNQFQLADQDPLGAVVGTRNNVQAQEIRQGGDFWKWTDVTDQLKDIKLRGLGISEAFLSGDSNYSNVETGMSVFMENTDTLRSNITYEVLTNKVFPIIAVANDFFKKGKQVDTESRRRMQFQLSNHHDLDIPTVRWHKRLEAKSEENMMELLDQLSTKGFPIPLRMWAAAAKVDINSLLQDLEQDELLKKQIAAITGVDADMIGVPTTDADGNPIGGAGVPGGGGGDDFGGDEGGDEDDSFAFGGDTDKNEEEDEKPDAESESPKPKNGTPGKGFGGNAEKARTLARLTAESQLRRVPLLSRKFGEDAGEVRAKSKTGKDKYIFNQARAQREMNELIVKASIELSRHPERRSQVLAAVRRKLGRVPKLV